MYEINFQLRLPWLKKNFSLFFSYISIYSLSLYTNLEAISDTEKYRISNSALKKNLLVDNNFVRPQGRFFFDLQINPLKVYYFIYLFFDKNVFPIVFLLKELTQNV